MTTESKIQKHVDEAAAKIANLMAVPSGNISDTIMKDRINDVLTTLALRAALSSGPEKCKECDEKLDQRLSVRCPKHVAMVLAGDFAKAKVKEHGPALMAKAMMGAQSWLESVMKDEEKDGESSEKPEA